MFESVGLSGRGGWKMWPVEVENVGEGRSGGVEAR